MLACVCGGVVELMLVGIVSALASTFGWFAWLFRGLYVKRQKRIER